MNKISLYNYFTNKKPNSLIDNIIYNLYFLNFEFY